MQTVNTLQQFFLITKQLQKKNIHISDYLFYAVTIIASEAGLKVKVKFTLQQAMNAQRQSSGIALLFL